MKTKARAAAVVAPPVRARARPSSPWQARPRVSAPGDVAERDADRMADEALRRHPTPAASLPGAPAPRIDGTATAAPLARQAAEEEPPQPEPEGDRELDDEDFDIPASARAATPPAAPPGFLGDVRAGGTGRGLEPDVRGRMESAFGRSFDEVRVHDDARSARLADAIDARAFAHGNDIFFAGGEYAPGTPHGDHLLAHELSHTIQRQSGDTVHRAPKKKAKKGGHRTPYEPTTMTDEEKIKRRIEFHEEAVSSTEQARARFRQNPTVDAGKRSRWIGLVDDAIASAGKIPDNAQRKIRLDYLRQARRLLDDPFFAQLLTTGKIWFDAGEEAPRLIGDPAVTLSDVDLQNAQALAAAMRGGADAFVTFLEESSIYRRYGIQPSELETAESSAEEAGSPGLAGPAPTKTTGPGGPAAPPGGAGAGGTIEGRKVLEEMAAALADLELDVAPGDTEMLARELQKLDEAARKDFYQFVRGLHDTPAQGGTPVTKTVHEMLDMFTQLDPAAREALMVNRELVEKGAETKDPLSGEVLLNLKVDAEKAQGAADNARRIQSSLDRIRAATLHPDVRKEMAGADFDGAAAFLEEMAMLQGLLAGGGSRSDLVKDVGQELIKEIIHFREKLERELIELAAEMALWAVASAVTQGAASPGLILALRRLKTLKQLIDTLRRVYNIYQRINQVVMVVANAGQTYEQFRGWFEGASARFHQAQAALESIETSEDLEESIEAQEEKLLEELDKQLEGKFGEILEMMYIPDDTPPEELRQILFDIPHGISALEEMWHFYLNSSGSQKFAEVLAIKAFKAGRLLYPLVGLTAALVAEQLQAAFPERTVEDRINRLISKKKRGPGVGQRNRSLFGRLRRKDYEYTDAALRPHLTAARDALRKAIDDDEPGSGESEHWAPAWFKYTVRKEIKEVNKSFRGKTVEATRKQKKPGGGTTRVKETVPLPPFRVRVRRPGWDAKRLTAEIKINPTLPLEVDRLSNDDFKPPGLEFTTTQPKRQDSIRKFLRDAGYELIKDPNGGEHIRLPGAIQKSKNRSYLHIDGGGRIVAGIDKAAYRRFLGNVVHDSRQLPEGYYAVHLKGEDTVSLKNGLAAAGHQKLGLDANHKLIEGSGSAPPKEVAKPGITKPTLESFDHAAGLAAMFAPATPGGPNYHLQDRSRALWQKTIDSQEELRQRPKSAKGRLGYIVRARALGDLLGSRHITELHTQDDKGHLIAKRFGGVDDYGNLVPMLRRENQFPGKWYAFESDMADVYIGKKAEPGHYVDFELSLVYPTAKTRRPSKFVAKFQEKDAADKPVPGRAKHKTVDND